jgi:hypothetical protein
VSGTITVVVSDVPDAPQKPTVPGQGDEGTVQLGFQAPASNGKEITSYEVRSNPSVATPANCAPPSCLITGLTNGTSYQFSVRAINEHGPGAWSVWSNAVIPYGTPGTPVVTVGVADQWAPNAVISASWTGVTSNGGTVTYRWRLDGGSWQSTSGTSTGNQTVQGGSHTFEVYAVNSGGKEGAQATGSRNIQVQSVPPTPTNLTATVTDSQAPGAITWSWSGVSASPGGTSNLSYEISINGGSTWTNLGASTSYSRSGLSAGSYSATVRAANKAGRSNPSGSASGTVVNPPTPPTATLCFRGSNPSYYTIRYSNLSGGTHSWRMVDEGGPYGDGRSSTGSSGTVNMMSYIYYSGPGDPDGDITAWAEWSDGGGWNQGTHTLVKNIPAC